MARLAHAVKARFERGDRTLRAPDGLRVVSESHYGARMTGQLCHQSYFDTVGLES